MSETPSELTPSEPAPDEPTEPTPEEPSTIDYHGSQAEIDAAKERSYEADRQRLADEHPDA